MYGNNQQQYSNYYDPYNQQPQQQQQQPPPGGPPPPQQQQQPQQHGGGGGYNQQGPPGMMGMMDPNQLMANPMVKDMAMQYGQQFVGQGQEAIKEQMNKYISIGQLKYYFAVDTSYVAKKLGILLFPVRQNDFLINGMPGLVFTTNS